MIKNSSNILSKAKSSCRSRSVMKIIYSGNISFWLKHKIKSVLKCACQVLGQPKNLEVEISFVDVNEIRRLNRENRNIDKSTDVLSFPMYEIRMGKSIDLNDYAGELENNRLMIGSIAICEAIAASQAVEYGHSKEREICFLALHGFLHLLGYDHIEKDDEELMQSVAELVLIRKGLKRGENG